MSHPIPGHDYSDDTLPDGHAPMGNHMKKVFSTAEKKKAMAKKLAAHMAKTHSTVMGVIGNGFKNASKKSIGNKYDVGHHGRDEYDDRIDERNPFMQ